MGEEMPQLLQEPVLGAPPCSSGMARAGSGCHEVENAALPPPGQKSKFTNILC